MSRWHEFRTCSNCKFLSGAETDTGFGCYQSKKDVYPVTPERPACASWMMDVRPNYEPVSKWSDIWDEPSYRNR